jgi:hypothetical protein
MGVLDEVEKLDKKDNNTLRVLKNLESNQKKIIKLLEEILREVKKKK